MSERDGQCGRCLRTSGPDNKKAGIWLRDESKADIGTSQLQLSRLDCALMLQTSPYSFTYIHSNCRGVVVQALMAIPRGTDLLRRHASPKLAAGVCRASKNHETRANCALHAQSCAVLIKVGKKRHTGAVGALASLSSNRFMSEGALAGRGRSCAWLQGGSAIVAWAGSAGR